MPVHVVQEHDGIAEVVIDHPPVNALDVAGWFDLADALIAAGRVPENRVVILRAEGRGFCAGVDIKEINAKGDEALVGVNRGCAPPSPPSTTARCRSSPPCRASAWAAASAWPATPTW